MHFQVSRQLRESPDVKIFFHGLLTFSPEPGGGCFIGVQNKSADHFFSVEVTVDEQPPHPNLPLLRLAGPLKSQLEITTDSPTTGVKKFVPNDYLFDRAVENHPNDFRWTLDLQGPEFHNHELELDPAGIQPAIRLTEGLLHTAQLTARECRITRMTAYGQNELELHRIAAIIGANIYLGRGRKLSLTWRDENGSRQQLTLPPDDIVPNKKYIIYINNAPAYSPSGGSDHDELGEYYKVVTNATERFKLVFACARQFENTTRVPCMSAIFGG